MKPTINWSNIRVHKTSQNSAFEELVCQLASSENIINKKSFNRIDAPDGGVEAYCTLKNGNEIGWQAKYFINSLTDVQWKQVGASFSTALDKHPSLTKYCVCFPRDLQDPRIQNKKSAKDKWNEYTAKWSAEAKVRGRKIEFVYWGSFELIERLLKPINVGMINYWFNENEFSNQWFKDRLDESIIQLGSRYTPKLNFELEIGANFNGIYRSNDYRYNIENLYHEVLLKGDEVKRVFTDPAFTEFQGGFDHNLEQLKHLFGKITYSQIIPIEQEAWTKVINSIFTTCNRIEEKMEQIDVEEKNTKLASGEIKKEDTYSRYYIHRFGYEKRKIREFEKNARDLSDFIKGPSTGGFNNPFILLKGEKGIGKSHLLADIAVHKKLNGNPSILLLGQHFNEDDPWVQILSRLGILGNKEEFLGALNTEGQSLQCRIPIIIDAINEGAGIRLWPNYISSFINTIKKYEWLGLILSIRTPYEEEIFENDYVENHLIEITHFGFDANEYEASKFFFAEYGIEQPKIPLLYPEFRQPLFLKLFCEGLKKANKTAIPNEGYEGITEIMGYLVKAINTTLSSSSRLSYSKSLDIVDISLQIFITKVIETNKATLDYNDAHILLENSLKPYNIKSGILEELISEGLLSKTLYRLDNKYVEGVYFTYQRYEDHFKAKYLLDKYVTKDSPKAAFKVSGEIGKLFNDKVRGLRNIALLEALAIQVPEKIGLELFQVLPQISNYNNFIFSVLDSLLWRKNASVNGKILNYVKRFGGVEIYDHFINIIVLLSGKPGNYYNANYLHKWLMGKSLIRRDAHWSSLINNRFQDTYAVKRLIDWAWNRDSKNNISGESLLLVGTTITWFFTSSNRNLRDSATKGLTCILKDRLTLAIHLLKKFEKVNDISVKERIYASIYGAVLVSKDKKGLPELCKYIYSTIFRKKEIIAHILLRDYARNIVEFGLYLGELDKIDTMKIRPPYHSSWYEEIPTTASIRRMEKKFDDPKSRKKYYGQSSVIDSVIGHPGDFGNYTASGIYSNWKITREHVQNLIIMRALDFGDLSEVGSLFDKKDYYSDRHTHKIERIGKKYQWLAFYEIAAKISDNKSFSNRREGNYNGPWIPYLRDIDPTLLITKAHKVPKNGFPLQWWFTIKYDNWDVDNKKWVHQKSDLPEIKNILKVIDHSNEDWIVLDIPRMHWESHVPLGLNKYDIPRKDIRYEIASYLVPVEKKDLALKFFSNPNSRFNGRDYRHPVYEVFSREYYWSPAYNDNFKYEDERGISFQNGKKGGKEELLYTSSHFLWEEEFDYSKDEPINIIKPSKPVFDGLNLIYSDREGEFLNSQGEMICFDPSVNNESNPCLIVRKKELCEFLNDKKLVLIWNMSGEKRLHTGRHPNRNDYWGRSILSGTFTLSGNEIAGTIKTKIEER